MKQYKPSELPLNTVIEFEDDEYIRKNNWFSGPGWEPLGCEDCRATSSFSLREADSKFKNFKIIALPVEVIENILDGWDKQDEFIDQAISALVKPKVEEPVTEWQVIPNYDLYEINREGVVRKTVNGEIVPEIDGAFGKKVNLWNHELNRNVAYSVNKVLEDTFK
jgi:hypothetical protein